MQKQIIKSITVLVGAILFDFLFYKEFRGLNVLLITLFFEAALFYFYRESFAKPNVRAVAIGTLLIALCVVYTSSNLAVVTYLISFSILVGLTQLPELRFLFFGSALYLVNFLEVPRNIASSVSNMPLLKRNPRWRNYVSPVIMSVLVGGIFFVIYYVANPRFASATSSFFDALYNIFSFAFDIGHILFFGVCFFITGAALWKHTMFDFSAFQNTFLQPETTEEVEHIATDANAQKTGTVILITINLLLLLNNMTDVPFVWFNQHSNFSPADMKSFVHEGTYFLIFGILLAMGVLLWLFRRTQLDTAVISTNPKFTKNMLLLAMAWLAQNTFLALSVGMRNAHYIGAYGLAYKRVGVIFFLVLVLCSLWFLYQKIKTKETSFQFLSRNTWSFYATLLVASFVPWDTFITQYNISHTAAKNLDVRFLLNDVSEKNTYQLIQNRDYLIECAKHSDVSLMGDYAIRGSDQKIVVEEEFDRNLAVKKARIEKRMKYTSWKSWNYADYLNGLFLMKNGK